MTLRFTTKDEKGFEGFGGGEPLYIIGGCETGEVVVAEWSDREHR